MKLLRHGPKGHEKPGLVDARGTMRDLSSHLDDITNATNRSPYPTLHLIREDSIDRAVEAFPEAETIFEANMATLRQLGPDGWAALDVGPRFDPDEPPAT